MEVEQQQQQQQEEEESRIDKEEEYNLDDDDNDGDDDDEVDNREEEEDEMMQEISPQPSQEAEDNDHKINTSNDAHDGDPPLSASGAGNSRGEEVLDDEEEENIRKEREGRQVRFSLWKGALEIFIHQLLYVRRIYPKDSFCSTRFLGVQCHACRHPKVVSYIGNSLKVGIPAIVSEGSSAEMVVDIYDQVKMHTYERYSLTFKTTQEKKKPRDQQQQQQQQQSSEDNDQSTDFLLSTSYDINEVESELRDLICSVGSLARKPAPYWPNSVSFKILLLQKGGSDTNAMTVIGNALAEAKWYKSNTNTDTVGGEKKRLIYDIPYCGCKFQYRILRQPIQRKRKVRIQLPLPLEK
jgi:hypothetical protein